jgi:disulfide bond formation protein DsbB
MSNKVIGFTVALIIGIIAVVILLQSGAALATPFNNAGLANSQLCVNANPGCFWNASRAVDCTTSNTTAADTTECTSPAYEQPLGSFFEIDGVMPLVFMAVFIIASIVILVLLIRKKKG